jgi:hypothetical protein
VRASRRFMHSTSSPAASFSFIELVIFYVSVAPHPDPLPASAAREKTVDSLAPLAGRGLG